MSLIPKPFIAIEMSKYEELKKIEKSYKELNDEKLKNEPQNIHNPETKISLKEEGFGLNLATTLEESLKRQELLEPPNAIPEDLQGVPKAVTNKQFEKAVNDFHIENPSIIEKQQDEVLQSKFDPFKKVVGSKNLSDAKALLHLLENESQKIYDDKGFLTLGNETIPNSNIQEIFYQLFNPKLSIRAFYQIPGLSTLVDFAETRGFLPKLPKKVQNWIRSEKKLPKIGKTVFDQIEILKLESGKIPIEYFAVVTDG